MDIEEIGEVIQLFCEPAFLLTQEGAVLALNPSACEWLDATDEAIVGKPLTALVCQASAHVARYLQSCAGSGQPALGALSWCCFEQSQKIPCYGQQFSSRYILLRCVPQLASFNSTHDGPVNPLQRLQEITQQRWLVGSPAVSEIQVKIANTAKMRSLPNEQVRGRQRERLGQFNRFSILNEMAIGIAHEINQPLTGIATYAQGCRRQLESGRADIAELLGILDKISEQARQSGEFVHSLCKLAKKHGGKRERCDVNELVQASLKLLGDDGILATVSIDVALSARKLPVVADSIQIQQALLHLLHNAIEATVEPAVNNTVIAITTQLDDERGLARVAVTDSGMGLSVDARDKLFDPFYTTKPHNLGMGLAVCRTVISAHAGHIGFTDPPGGGTTLYFTLPLALTMNSDD